MTWAVPRWSTVRELRKLAPTVFGVGPVVRIVMTGGVVLYAGVGVEGLLLGGNYLDYNVLAHDAVHGQHLGIALIEFGVGTTVASVMIAIFYAFAGRGRVRES